VADLEASVKSLVRQGDSTAEYIEGLRTDIRRQTWTMRVAILTGTVILLVLASVVLDNRHRVESLQHKMCPMVTILIPGPTDPQPPEGPTGDRGRDVIGRATTLAGAFGCDAPLSEGAKP
jgi:hypothetical protein